MERGRARADHPATRARTVNPASKRWSRQTLIRDGVSGLLTWPTLWLLQAWLHIQVRPLSITGGWQPLVAWFFLFWLVFGFWARLALRLLPPAPPRPAAVPNQPDPYTIVQAEFAAERPAPKA